MGGHVPFLTLFRAHAIALAALAMLCCWPAAAAERRVALVVGASVYKAAPRLPNTTADATETAASLRRLSFDVDLVLDPDRAALEAAVRRLGERANGADAALFFFAGHGLEVSGRNWLLPISAQPRASRDLPFEALDLGLIFDQLDGAARVSLFILDACRDSPFRLQLTQGTRGAVAGGMRAQQAAVGSLIAYATAPGTQAADGAGSHSPFTAALLKHIERPGLTVQQVLNAVRTDVKAATRGKQIPWESSALEGDFYFVPPPPVVASAPVTLASNSPVPSNVAPKPPRRGSEAEELFFQSIKDSKDPAELQAYLARYPNGIYEPLVRVWLRQRGAEPAPAVVPVLAPAPSTGDLDARLAKALRTALPNVSDLDRQAVARRFLDARSTGRALATHPPSGAHKQATGFDTNAAAAAHALERCAWDVGRPCALIAEGTTVLSPGAAGAWQRRDQPWLSYTGLFEPALIPVVDENVRKRPDVQGYRALKGAKAAAIRLDGLFIATAETQRLAEALALRKCAPDLVPGDLPCHLYAIADGVVLPRWHMTSISPAAETPGPEAVEPIAAAAFHARASAARMVRTEYANYKEHRAVAIHLPTGWTYSWDGVADAGLAERWALEGCQIRHDVPCVLVGVDLEVRAPDPRTAAPRVMDRVGYSGPFRLDKVPMGMERHKEVQNYASLPGERAIAIRPNRALVRVASGMVTRAEAEKAALARCNVPGDPSPCFLYASGDRVVLPARQREARP